MYKKSGIYPLLALGVWLLCSSATVLAQQVWRAGIVLTVQEVAHRGMDSCFCSQPIPDDVFARMQGCSFRPIPISPEPTYAISACFIVMQRDIFVVVKWCAINR